MLLYTRTVNPRRANSISRDHPECIQPIDLFLCSHEVIFIGFYLFEKHQYVQHVAAKCVKYASHLPLTNIISALNLHKNIRKSRGNFPRHINCVWSVPVPLTEFRAT